MYSKGSIPLGTLRLLRFSTTGPQDMMMSSDPEQILASLLSVNDIQEDNGRCSNTCKVCNHPHVIQESYISNPRCLVR